MKSLSQQRFTSKPIDLNMIFDGGYEEPVNLPKLKPGDEFNAALDKREVDQSIAHKWFNKESKW